MALLKVQEDGRITIPSRLRNQAGISAGDTVEAAFQGGKIVLTRKITIDRSKFPTADDEYTPEQRAIIDARLAESAADVKAGRLHGPFDTHEAMIEFLHDEVKKAKSAGRRKSKAR